MSDGFPDRLTQLRARWQGDPSSRVFLQLAEEYRHLGRVQEALEVLQRGLQEHPGYLSALVAKGRCLLELGDAAGARAVLERVVQQDATQMVANKLLVRACLETGEPERARERLDLYTLLNDSDPEIEELRRRVEAMSRPPQAADEPRWEEAAEGSPMSGTEMPAGTTQDVFDLGSPAPLRAALPSEDSVFDLSPPAPAAHAEVPASAPAEPPAADPTAAGPAGIAARGHGTAAEPFPDPAPAQSLESYLAGLAAEQIFAFDVPAAAAATAAAPIEAAAPVAPAEPFAGAGTVAGSGEDVAAEGWESLTPEPFEPAAQPAAWAPAAAEPDVAPIAASAAAAPAAEEAAPAWMQAASAPFAVEAVEEVASAVLAPAAAGAGAELAAAAAESAAVSPAAAALPAAGNGAGVTGDAHGTATLGELYLRQGHLGEAERIFQEVLHREPRNVVALGALDEIERRRKPLDAATLLAGHGEPDAPPATRKAYLLRGYLTRLRQVRRPHVS
jgi:tetratricopeptide (TPR) repeat protein